MAAKSISRQGKLEGSEEHGIQVFRGVPFARPPVAELRWRAPQPPPSWRGVRDATQFGPAAPQNASTTRLLRLLGIGPAQQSEDCLYLNIWTPAADRKRRPVMVWIHGGAFVIGCGSTPWYAGGRMAKRGDVVVVTINYRLGALGFLNLHALTAGEQANFGLRDQIAALEWVRDNIEQFGGDPEKVTILGESAGAMSVSTLLGSPRARNLFRRVIAQSGAASNVSTAQRGAEVGEELVRQLGHPRLDVDRLRRCSVGEVLNAQMRASLKSDMRAGVLPWQPSLDNEIIPTPPLAAIADGIGRDVQLLVGTNRDEWQLFMLGDPSGRRLDHDRLRKRFERAFAHRNGDADLLSSQVFDLYVRNGTAAALQAPQCWSNFQSDRIFHHPARRLADAQARQGAATFAYLFTWKPPLVGSWVGSCHGLEIPFVFGTVRDGLFRHLFASQQEVRELSEVMQAYWTSFAHNGVPQHPTAPSWPRYDVERRATMVLGRRRRVEESLHPERHQFWTAMSA